MKNIIDYLYYKLFRAAKQSALKDTPFYFASVLISVLLGINIFVIFDILDKFSMFEFPITNKYLGSCFMVLVFIFINLVYRKRKISEVIRKYSLETESDRKRGNLKVAIYVAISVLLLFVVPLL
jgi:hypothetical protein